jgi:hypothetical protein
LNVLGTKKFVPERLFIERCRGGTTMRRNTLRTLLLSTAIMIAGAGVAAAQGMQTGGGAAAQTERGGARAHGGAQVRTQASGGHAATRASGAAHIRASQSSAVRTHENGGAARSRMSASERAGARNHAATRHESRGTHATVRSETHGRTAQSGANRNRTESRAESRTRAAAHNEKTNRHATARGETRQRETTGQASGRTSRDERAATRATRERSTTGAAANDTREQSRTQIRTSRTTITARQQTRLRETVTRARNVPRVTRVDFALRTGVVVPRHVHFVSVAAFPVLVDVFPAYRPYSFFVAEDEVVFVDNSHRIVDVVPLEGAYAAAGPAGGSAVIADVDLTPAEIRDVQEVLIEEGFPVAVTGVWDVRTREALVTFQRRRGLPVGRFDTRTVAALHLTDKISRSHVRETERTTTTGQGIRERSTERSQVNTREQNREPAARERGRAATTGQGGAAERMNEPGRAAERDNAAMSRGDRTMRPQRQLGERNTQTPRSTTGQAPRGGGYERGHTTDQSR